MQRKAAPRTRWGIMWKSKKDKTWTGPLGTGWAHPRQAGEQVPDYVDFWPMSFRTRAEARRFCRERGGWAAVNGTFQEVQLTIRVTW